MSDLKIFRYALVVLCLPVFLASGCQERYRYPCQDPANWGNAECKLPVCDITRTCPEHIFKGQRDPRLGPPTDVAVFAKPADPLTTGCVNVK